MSTRSTKYLSREQAERQLKELRKPIESMTNTELENELELHTENYNYIVH